MEQKHDERYLFLQLSHRPLGLMETRHPYGLCLLRLGSGLGFDASLGYQHADNNLKAPRRWRRRFACITADTGSRRGREHGLDTNIFTME